MALSAAIIEGLCDRPMRMSELVAFFNENIDVGVVTTLREVVLAAHTEYMPKTRAKLGAAGLVEQIVRDMQLGRVLTRRVPSQVWAGVVALSPTQAGELVDLANRGLWSKVS